ncbi:MAG: ABC transporter ATP-binding protein [Eubacteriales bacterium]|nr:ABC transporter ATP-binding protein [Eubacteriales bacterium]
MIEARNIKKSFGSRVLFENLSFTFTKGILLVEGKSGCGKSTLLSLLMSSLPPDEGTVLYGKEDFSYAYCGQKESLLLHYSLEENQKKLSLVFLPERYQQLCRLLRYPSSKKKLCDLSGGERAKAEIIACLSQEKDVYFLDEPFSSLDKTSCQSLLAFLKEFSLSHSLVLVNHIESLTGLEPTMKILFEEGGVRVEGKEHPQAKSYPMKRTKNMGFGMRKTLFTAPFFHALEAIFFLLSGVFFGLSVSFENSGSFVEKNIQMAKQDVFHAHECSLTGSSLPDSSLLLSAEERGGIPSLGFYSQGLQPLYLYGSLDEGEDFYFYSNMEKPLLSEEMTLTAEAKSYPVKIAKQKELSNLFRKDTIDNRMITDSLAKRNILFVTSSLLEDVLERKLKTLSFSSSSASLEYPLMFPDLSIEYSSRLKAIFLLDGEMESNVLLEEKEGYYLSGPNTTKGQKILFDGGGEAAFIADGPSEDGKWHLSLASWKLLLMARCTASQVLPTARFLTFHFNDEDLFPFLREAKGGFFAYKAELNYADRLISKRNLYLLLSLLFLGASLLFPILCGRGLSHQQRRIRSLYETHQLSLRSYSLSVFLSETLLALPSVLLNLILYPVVYLPHSNLLARDTFFSSHLEGYGIYSQQPLNPYYDDLTGVLQVYRFEGMIFLLLLLLLAGLFVGFLLLRLPGKKERKSKEKRF